MDGILGKEILDVLMNLSRLMAGKLEEPISHVHVQVNSLITIDVTRSYYRIIYRTYSPSTLRDRDPDWDLGSCLVLAQYIVHQNNFARIPAQTFLPPT